MIPTVLLGGTLCDERLFDAMLPGLAAPLILDHRGFDRADAAAAALIDHIPAGALAIGFSLGGWIVLELAQRWPGRLVGAVLISGNAYPDAAGNAAGRRDRVERGRQIGLGPLIEAEKDLLLGKGSRSDPSAFATVRAMAERCGHEVHARQAELNIHRGDHRSFVATTDLPILVVAGDQDPLCPRERYEEAAAGPRSHLRIIEGAGHFLPLEAPRATLEAIEKVFPEACR